MATLTYELLPTMDSTAPIFQQLPNGKRVRITKIPSHRPTLQELHTDKDGKSRTIRFKRTVETPWQDEQIETFKILANEKFTDAEREAAYFRNGQLTTNLVSLQKFFAVHPENEEYDGQREPGKSATFRLVDAVKDKKEENNDFKKRLKAGNKIDGLNLNSAQALLIRLNGFAFKTPDDLIGCQNMLVKYLNDAEEEGVELILKDDNELNIDEQTTVLIGKLVNAGVLSFDQVDGKISKKARDGKWVDVRDMSSDYSMDEKKRLFSDFLNTADGKTLKTDLENDLAKIEAKSKNN